MVSGGDQTRESAAKSSLAQDIGRRIATIRGDISQTDFSKSLGIHKSSLIRYEKGERLPDAEFVLKMHLVYHVSPLWLLTGEGVIRRSHATVAAELQKQPTEGEGEGEYALVPLYDVQASAGHGAVVESERISDYLAFKRDWLWRELRASEQDLYLLEVDGESMEPTLRPGDIILVDRRQAEGVPRDGIYLLRLDDSLLVKRLQRLPGHRVRVSSDNAAYEPFEVDLEAAADQLKIVGRVVWAGRRL